MSKRRKFRSEPCPYCGAELEDECEHLLLRIDVGWGELCGGILNEEIEDRWTRISEAEADSTAFDEDARFAELVAQVEKLADAESEFSTDGPPGWSSTYRAFYASTPERAAACLAKYVKE